MKRKNFIWNLIGTTINSFSSLIFLIVITRINGLEIAGIFSFGFSLACLFYYIGIYNGRVFQITEDEVSDKEFILSKLITCALMFVIFFIFICIKNYSYYKSSIIFILCVFKMIEAFSEGYYGILQKYDKLYKVGLSLTAKNILNFIILIVVNILTKDVFFVFLINVVINLLITIFYDYYMVRKYMNKKIKFENCVKILKIGFLPFVISFLSLFIINIPKYVIDIFGTEKMQAIFGIIVMPATIMTLCAQFILYPYIVDIKKYLEKKEWVKLNDLVFKLVFVIFLIGLFSIFAAYFLGIPMLNFVYDIDLNSYKNCLIIIMIGSLFSGMSFVFLNVLITLRKIKKQLIIYLSTTVFSLFLSFVLIRKFMIVGASISFLLTMFILCMLLLIVYKNFIKKERL